MPASPAMRFSPGRESRADNHKRGRSLENGIVFKERDDDLALFNEVQSRERDNFLLQSNDDFEDTFVTKLRHFSDHKLGINVAARGESSDFLNTEEEKNDYEWLITPPDTPLFSSLDDETQTPQVILPQRGRPRAQPISISRSSTMEKSQRSSRSSQSPNRITPSPQSSNITFQPSTTSRKPSSPSSKPSTPPTSQRLSTGSTTTRGISGISPVKTTRGNSASPKIRAWQANIPGFSTEAPPNLRTCLADRPASYVRGSSPASRNSRQSMSPTPSRSISSSHSHERDRFSPRSKGSIASSGDDDVESLPSVIGLNSRKVSGFRNNNNNNNNNNSKGSFSQKPSRTVASNSAPKRSFDVALRQMDPKRVPQNMFRPLLSSAPSSTFYPAKSTPAWNSSVTTSSNASSDLATTTYAHEIQETELNDDEATSGSFLKLPDSSTVDDDDQVFIFEKTDSLNEDVGNENHKNSSPTLQFGDFKNGFENLADCDAETCEVLDDFKDIEVETLENTLLCSRCGCRYSNDITQTEKEKEIKLCENCQNSYSSLKTQAEVVAMSDKDHESFHTMKPQTNPVVEVEVEVEIETLELTPFEQHEDLVKDGESSFVVLSERSEEKEATEVNHQVISQPTYDQIQHEVDFSDPKLDSVVLKKSNSIKGVVVKSGNFSSSSISFDDLSYVRESTNSIRSSLGRGSFSASSSFDFGQTTHTDTRFNPQLSKKMENHNHKHHQRSMSSFSATSSHAFHPSSVGTSTLDSFEVSSVHVGKDVADVASIISPQETPCENDTWTENEEVEIHSNSELATFNQTDPVLEEVLLHESSNFEDLGKDDNEEEEVEVEIDQSCCSCPDSLCNVSQNLENNIEELEDHTSTSNHATGIIEEESESLVLIEGEGKSKGRRLTLEEATDTILFCSSIVHNIAYEAATLSIQKQHSDTYQTENNNTSMPLIQATKDVHTKKAKKTSSKSKKKRHKKATTTTTTKPPNNNNTNTNEETDLAKPRIVYPNNKENRRPPKLESKCNCSIM